MYGCMMYGCMMYGCMVVWCMVYVWCMVVWCMVWYGMVCMSELKVVIVYVLTCGGISSISEKLKHIPLSVQLFSTLQHFLMKFD